MRQVVVGLVLIVVGTWPTQTAAQPPEIAPQFVMQWSVPGAPVGIEVDDYGVIYVVTRLNNDLQRYTTEGQFLGSWGSYGSGDGEFNMPNDVAVDQDGFVYVADGLNHRIQKFTRNGSYVAQWGTHGTEAGELDVPYGVAADRSGRVLVVDHVNCRVQRFSNNGVFLDGWGSLGSGPGEMNEPIGIAIDDAAEVYITDNSNHRVQVFSDSGEFLRAWGTESLPSIPHGICLDALGHVYVVERLAYHRIHGFSKDGVPFALWGNQGSGPGEFLDAEGIAVDVQGNIYVADKANNRIQKFAYLPIPVSPTTWGRLKQMFGG